jgi:hypothetical protein
MPARPAAFDYDADGRSDISVFRPSSGAWYLQQSTAGVFGMEFGYGTDKIAPADYDGDSRTDIAVYRPGTGIWYIYNSSTSTVSYNIFGLADDSPTPADYDGDGRADVRSFARRLQHGTGRTAVTGRSMRYSLACLRTNRLLVILMATGTRTLRSSARRLGIGINSTAQTILFMVSDSVLELM